MAQELIKEGNIVAYEWPLPPSKGPVGRVIMMKGQDGIPVKIDVMYSAASNSIPNSYLVLFARNTFVLRSQVLLKPPVVGLESVLVLLWQIRRPSSQQRVSCMHRETYQKFIQFSGCGWPPSIIPEGDSSGVPTTFEAEVAKLCIA
ncbi:unnamed protein product [Sphenostylis stenocarpa]|uniref:Uncharacterized protein n=1 Tax=Sphenostylis stenocarpa TaxID=92480 RepID=A0AA86SBG7_9FABA|nr:unnamed protein product [Sphenostylis stenocarpa]